MRDNDLLRSYNYDSFMPDKFGPWMRWGKSPPLGEKAPDFPLWKSENRKETSLHELWSTHAYTVVEFGSFT